ncbi:L-histidine N(alpha)-methyltransferase [Modestobacter sp. I12A-02628]|uniref:Histidine N-alpha-methyltransferase n=1 Tax=Goekera deserti TaxID=2497753 RepID=A0A7K3WI10_9ACTN|nr:L-histidine N(alpha)-methyltransferase [Goekera deserti]MPQ97746.1 L-histidine N(alpha)-methyltransferase [Goekera deserti]NDI48391.1 L-histidine N(alpha)-methyltransferase [Goekera deserti]NEL55992.1 L-histidine N(alpha)-methyltransferase [Goekera deserti]
MTVELTSYLGPDDAEAALRADVLAGLTTTPKTLPPTWFYDERGSELFDEITRLPEYYPTRAEREVLADHAGEIAAASGADTLVELGSGTSEKTRLLLTALAQAGTLRRFVPFDVDPSVLRAAGAAITEEHPGVVVQAVVGDFTRHLGELPRAGRRLVAFLGSTIGNLEPGPRAAFLAALAATLQPGDAVLLGTDLVKDPGRLVRAYDDAAGVTAAFNRNVLSVVNRELKADFDPDAFEHVARWDAEREWIEMRLRSTRDQVVHVAALDLEVPFAAGEELRTEVSTKFRRETVTAELAAAGLTTTHWWTDAAGDFGVSLSVPG